MRSLLQTGPLQRPLPASKTSLQRRGRNERIVFVFKINGASRKKTGRRIDILSCCYCFKIISTNYLQKKQPADENEAGCNNRK